MSAYELTLMAAIGPDRGLGKDGSLIYKSSADMRWFNRVTLGGTVIVGRKTFQEIMVLTKSKGLPDRNGIVVSKNNTTGYAYPPSTLVAGSINEAIQLASLKNAPVHVIGGGTVYQQTLPLADRLILTEFKALKSADTFFPEFKNDFREIARRRLTSLGEDWADTEADVVIYYRK